MPNTPRSSARPMGRGFTAGDTVIRRHHNADSRREAKLYADARTVASRPSAYNTTTSAHAEMELRSLIIESWIGGRAAGHRRQPKRGQS